MNGLALYIHFPYCLEKCSYCDFHSVPVTVREVPHQVYTSRLLEQVSYEVERLGLRGRPLTSIFFGGGTPSLLAVECFDRILSSMTGLFSVGADCEITVETNPATVNKETFQKWRTIGINRVSIGVQSFQDPLLKKLGRNHSAAEAKEAITASFDAGFSNVSSDLIFGISGETLSDLEKDLEQICFFPLSHISAYQLTVEPSTPLAHAVASGTVELPSEERLLAMHQRVPQFFETHGFSRYEISNYAKKNRESVHNLKYWRYGEYLGIGSGAVAAVAGKRWRTTRKLKNYLAGDWNYEEEEIIDPITAWKERWMMGLRLTEGVILREVDQPLLPLFLQWAQEKLAILESSKIFLTQNGLIVINQLLRDLFALIDKVAHQV